jgi:hypothetical protein
MRIPPPPPPPFVLTLEPLIDPATTCSRQKYLPFPQVNIMRPGLGKGGYHQVFISVKDQALEVTTQGLDPYSPTRD